VIECIRPLGVRVDQRRYGWTRDSGTGRPGAGRSHTRRALLPHGRELFARLGHTNAKGIPLQLALFAQEFSDVVVFRSPPPAAQRAIFATLAPIARWRGYHATYPQVSRTVLARREGSCQKAC
jgi:hypothetical protein